MSLFSMIYCSQLSEDIHNQDFAHILDSSHRNNPKQQVTGLLCFSQNCFIQYIEGELTTVNKLFQKISRDPRHHDVVLLHAAPITKRNFAHWDMGYIGEQHFTRCEPVLFQYGQNLEFDPYQLTGELGLQFLQDLAKVLTLK